MDGGQLELASDPCSTKMADWPKDVNYFCTKWNSESVAGFRERRLPSAIGFALIATAIEHT
jgi:hypothetical protein